MTHVTVHCWILRAAWCYFFNKNQPTLFISESQSNTTRRASKLVQATTGLEYLQAQTLRGSLVSTVLKHACAPMIDVPGCIHSSSRAQLNVLRLAGRGVRCYPMVTRCDLAAAQGRSMAIIVVGAASGMYHPFLSPGWRGTTLSIHPTIPGSLSGRGSIGERLTTRVILYWCQVCVSHHEDNPPPRSRSILLANRCRVSAECRRKATSGWRKTTLSRSGWERTGFGCSTGAIGELGRMRSPWR